MPSDACVKTLAASCNRDFRTLAGSDVFGEDDDPAEGPGTHEPGPHFPAKKQHGTVGAFKAVFIALDGFAAEGATMNGKPARGDIGKYLVMGTTKNV